MMQDIYTWMSSWSVHWYWVFGLIGLLIAALLITIMIIVANKKKVNIITPEPRVTIQRKDANDINIKV